MSTASKPAVEDLSIRARRGGLSSDEQRIFDTACAASPTLRVAHGVGRAFDAISGVRAGDEELIARIADRVLAPVAAPRARARRRWAWGFGFAAALVSSVAAAWWTGGVRPGAALPIVRGESGTDPPANARRPGPSVSRVSDVSFASESRSPTRAPHSDPEVRSLPMPSAREAQGSAASPADGAGVETASDWFRRANAARRAGDFAGAVALYGRLQASFPGSDEARLSHVSLGKLRLASGDPSEAERQFSLYLSEGGRELAEEALAGRAESLQRLGRYVEERQSWQRLLRDFTSSVYAARAKQRLEELGAQGL